MSVRARALFMFVGFTAESFASSWGVELQSARPQNMDIIIERFMADRI